MSEQPVRAASDVHSPASMPRRRRAGAAGVLLLALALAACGGGSGDSDVPEDTSGAAIAGAAAAGGAGGEGEAPLAFTAADLDAWERGMTKETELVRAAQERGRTATTPAERGEAAQAAFPERTAEEGARAAGMPLERYRRLRETVNSTLQTLDFQGKVDGPTSIDTARVGPEMKARLAADPVAALPPESAAAFRARLDRLVAVWSEYMRLTAMAG